MIDLSSRSRGRVRFPAPYRPAGTTSRSTGSTRYGGNDATRPGATTPDADPTSADRDRPGARASRPLDAYRRENRVDASRPDRGGSAVRGERKDGTDSTRRVPRSGPPDVRYGRGPVRRLEPPRRTAGAGASGRSSGSGALRPTPRSAKPTGEKAGSRLKPTGGVVRRVAEDLDRASRLDATRPGTSNRVSLSGDLIARGQYQALRASIGAVGGVYRAPYYGGGSRGGYHGYDHGYGYGGYGYGGYGYGCDYPSYYYPWGFGYYGNHWSFSLGFGWYSPCYSYWWPYYLSCWYPYWYSYYRPYAYYASYPAYYSSVVYRTVYVDDVTEGEEQAAAAEAPVQTPPAAPSSLSIAADRYLTLGDRAFREGKYTDAVQFYAKAVEYAPDEGALYLVLADALFAAGDYHYGAYAIRRALELDPSLVDANVDKHEFYPTPEEFDHQLAVLETYLVEHPTDRDARLVLALNYQFGKRPAAAVDLLASATSEALRGDPAAELILSAARRTQFGETPAEPARND